jgi:uncharacterized MAPEG superfamily protein
MPTEYLMLVGAVGVLFVAIIIQATAGVQAFGVVRMAGARDDVPALSGFAARAKRCVDNHREGLILFAPLILVAGALDQFSPMTALGAQLFFFSRVAHAALYLLGAPWVRPLAWAIGLGGTILIALALFDLV